MENSVGTNNLIKNGANMVTSVHDILDAFEEASFENLDSNAIGVINYDSKKAANRYGVSSKKHNKKLVRIGGDKNKYSEESEEASSLGMEKEHKEEVKTFVAMSPAEKCIYDCIPDKGEVSRELIITSSGQSIADVTMHLLSLNIKKAIIELPGGRYRRA